MTRFWFSTWGLGPSCCHQVHANRSPDVTEKKVFRVNKEWYISCVKTLTITKWFPLNLQFWWSIRRWCLNCTYACICLSISMWAETDPSGPDEREDGWEVKARAFEGGGEKRRRSHRAQSLSYVTVFPQTGLKCAAAAKFKYVGGDARTVQDHSRIRNRGDGVFMSDLHPPSVIFFTHGCPILTFCRYRISQNCPNSGFFRLQSKVIWQNQSITKLHFHYRRKHQ